MRLALLLVVAFTLLSSPGTCNAEEQTAGGWIQPIKEFPQLYQYPSTCNTFLLKYEDQALLFDCGEGITLENLKSIGVTQVDSVLITAHHRENLQGLDAINTEKVRIEASKEEQEILENPTSFRKWDPKLSDKYSVYGASYVRPLQHAVKVNRTLEDQSEYQWNDFSITCLATAGHSPGGMSYLIKSNEKTYAIVGGLIHDGAKMATWYDTEWDYGFAKGLDTLMESVKKIVDQKVNVILPDQGPIITNAADQLRTYEEKLSLFKSEYVRGYPVFDNDVAKRDPISTPTAVRHLRQVTPHLYKLSHDFLGRNFSIIISDNGRGLILDCGLFPKEVLDEIILGMQEHMGLKRIDAFWISHMHGDHFLLGPHLKEKYGAQAWTMESVVDRCENPRAYDYAAMVSAYGDGFDGMRIDRPIKDGEVVEWEGYKIHVDWMPGQTEFGCCLWLELDGKKIAFTGDNIFGSPADDSQTGHECIVCRNSALLSEGYIHGSRYLLNLNPDIVMGSHSYVMPEPQEFLKRYYDWSLKMEQTFQDLLPEPQYELNFDPYWVSAYPYRVDLTEADSAEVTMTIRNFKDTEQKHRVVINPPAGIVAEPAVLEGSLAAKETQEFKVKLTVNRSERSNDIHIVPLDITLDDRRYGELFDFIIKK